MFLDSPFEADEIGSLVDWLELSAILNADSVAHFDLIADAFGIGQDTEGEDIGDEDLKSEIIANDLAEEVLRRQKALEKENYPFEVTPNGELLKFHKNDNFGQCTYIISLIINHSWATGKLLSPAKLTDEELRTGREIFETLATVAAVGFVSGPAFLIGTNRENAIGLLARVATVCEIAGEGSARNQPHPAAPENANDDGVDIIALHLEQDGPPARYFMFGQSAAGANFKTKSIRTEIKKFLKFWFGDHPANTHAVMFIPAALSANETIYQTERLGHILHRFRMPLHAQLGAVLVEQNDELIHFVDDLKAPQIWLDSYMDRLQLGANP